MDLINKSFIYIKGRIFKVVKDTYFEFINDEWEEISKSSFYSLYESQEEEARVFTSYMKFNKFIKSRV